MIVLLNANNGDGLSSRIVRPAGHKPFLELTDGKGGDVGVFCSEADFLKIADAIYAAFPNTRVAPETEAGGYID